MLENIKMRIWNIVSWMASTPLMTTKLRMAIYRYMGVNLHTTAVLTSGVYLGSNKLTMLNNSFVNHGCFLDGSDYITLGSNVRLGPHVKILTGTHTYAHDVIRRGPGSISISNPVVIERGVWVGIGAIILPGVVIREGCVIGAGSVVIKSTQPNGLYAGNPARRIKDLPVE
jgi:maltose O-acetyltransferase